jgi:hypothetical protein
LRKVLEKQGVYLEKSNWLSTFAVKLLQNKMRNLFAFAAVAGLLTFASCDAKKAETSAETTIDTAAAPAMEAAIDSAAATIDSAAAVIDSAAEAVHGAAEKVEEHAEKM